MSTRLTSLTTYVHVGETRLQGNVLSGKHPVGETSSNPVDRLEYRAALTG